MMTQQLILDIASAEDMHSLGLALGRGLFKGAFIALYGDLGAGKTTLVKGIAEAWGIESVSSPTFTILNQYSGDELIINHFDAYRLDSYEELIAVGFEDCLSDGSAVIMEWCENVPEAVPENRLEVHISGSGDDSRRVLVRSFGSGYSCMIGGIEK